MSCGSLLEIEYTVAAYSTQAVVEEVDVPAGLIKINTIAAAAGIGAPR